ncbi:hypothetical protein Y1Q_0014639 [Alligator mississippiensis]|uniref:Uncharacterized protein n=1 Tax=Alligator mississippiensis TaxID=8496 RepID=A0A151P7V6_ALLMI|nr:hypothetical protein Y1Q_0014639 [Alligator mississippiensis]
MRNEQDWKGYDNVLQRDIYVVLALLTGAKASRNPGCILKGSTALSGLWLCDVEAPHNNMKCLSYRYT